MTPPNDIKDFPLGISGFHFSDLYVPERLKVLHQEFWKFATASSPDLLSRFESAGTLTPPKESEVLIDVASQLGEFIAKLFNVTTHAARLKSQTDELQPVFRFKKDFLHLRASKRFSEPAVDAPEFKEIDEKVKKILSHEPAQNRPDKEVFFAEIVTFLLDCEKTLKNGSL